MAESAAEEPRKREPATSRIPLVDLARQHQPLAAELQSAFGRLSERGDFVLGEELALFETEFAEYLDVKHCVGVASGTAALTIALTSCGIGPGDEVVVPAHTFIASALGVVHAGAGPVFCDVDPESGLLDLASAESVVTDRTAAVMAVHLYGQACDMEAICHFAERRGLIVIEDAAQAHGARWNTRAVGGFGKASASSFYPSKNLGAFGDAGAVCTSDPAIANRARSLRNLGQLHKGEHVLAGFNERMDTLQAAILRIKLQHLDRWNRERRQIAGWYAEELPGSVRSLAPRAAAWDVFHLFPVRVPKRDQVAAALGVAGIETGIHYSPPAHRQPPFDRKELGSLPVAEEWAREQLSLPMFPGLSRHEVSRVCSALRDALHESKAPIA